MTNLQVEARLRRAAVTYRRLAPTVTDFEPRILAQVAVTPRAPERKRFRPRSMAMQVVAAAALLVFALAVAFLIREARLHVQPQPVATPSPSFSASPPSKFGSGEGYKFSVYGMSMWHPGGMMVSPTIGWSGGNLLSRTTDGGAHWTVVMPSELRNATGPVNLGTEYLDATHAWIVEDLPDRTLVFATSDGGRTWRRGVPIMGGAGNSVQLSFVDLTHGWLLSAGTQFGPPFKLYGTTDGGLQWQRVAVSSPQAAGKPGTFDCTDSCLLAFGSPTVGVMTSLTPVQDDSGMSLLTTHDGGVTWQRQSLPVVAASAHCPCYVDRPVFLDSTHGFMVVWGTAGPLGAPLIGHLLVSSDAGATWSPRTLPGEAETDIGFSDPLHGWAIAGSVADLGSLVFANGPALPLPLYRTDDGGLTWFQVPNSLMLKSASGEIRHVDFLDQNIGFVFALQGGKPGYLKTEDGGRTWTPAGTVPPAPTGG